MNFQTIAKTLLVALAGENASPLEPSVPALPSDPDNAALLYYQAFLSLAKLDDEGRKLILCAANGQADPDDRVRQCIQKCRRGIELADAAARLAKCDWGHRFSLGCVADQPQLVQTRVLAWVLVADARVRMADGDCRGALERCLTTGRLARHIGNDTLISYLVSIATRALGHRCMVEVIGRAGNDASLLRWLKNELATPSVWELTAVRPLQIEARLWMDLMRMDRIETFADLICDGDESMRSMILSKATEESLSRMRRFYSEGNREAIRVLEASLPYEEAVAQLDRLCSDSEGDDLAGLMSCRLLARIARIYTLQTRGEAQNNATKAGVEICLRRLETGTLPDDLPEGLPKDPSSGEDFEYERTAEGFTLRCRAKEFKTERLHEYAFNLK